MSDFVEKTVGTLSSLFGNISLVTTNNDKIRKEYPLLWISDKSNFVKKLKAAPSKKDEETIITNFLSVAEKRLSQPNITEDEIEAYVQLSIVCEILGYPVPFIYVHAIKLAQKGNLQQKHTGYLAASSLLNPEHELVILLTNTIQKDLESSNSAEVLLGLKAVCNLMNRDTVHNVFYLVEQKLCYENSEVRKTACFAMNHCLILMNSESAYKMVLPKLEKALTDSNLEVVSSVISILHNLITKCPGDYYYLASSLIHLQNQLLERRIPNTLVYQSIPAPWLQIQILKLLPLLCTNSEQCVNVFPVLKSTLQKSEVNHQIAYAIISEVIATTIGLDFTEEMIQLALTAAGRLLKSDNSNLKYVGIQSFTKIIQKTKPILSPSQQENIMECLKHSDESLKLKTLELLYHLVNPLNAQIICRKIIECMIATKEEHRKKNLALQILQIANQYNNDHKWYISTINTIFTEAEYLIPNEEISKIVGIIQKDSTNAFKEFAKKSYIEMCQQSCPSSSIIKIICSIFDCFEEFEYVLPHLEKMDEDGAMWLLIMLRNTILKTHKVNQNIIKVLKDTKFSSNLLQQLQFEIIQLMDLLGTVENLQLKEEVDVTLSHLDDYVCEALSNGLPCYKPPALRLPELSEKTTFDRSNLNMDELSLASWSLESEQKKIFSLKSPSYDSVSSSSVPLRSQSSKSEMPENLKIERLWTKEGRIKTEQKCEEVLSSPFEQILEKTEETAEQIFAGVS